MQQERKEFLLAEYKALREEVLDAVREVPKNERLALISSGAFWSWFAIQVPHNPYLVLVIPWLPLGLTYLLHRRAKSLDGKFRAYHEYLLKLEETFETFDQNNLGWEHNIKNKGTDWFPDSERLFWRFLVGANLVLIPISYIYFS